MSYTPTTEEVRNAYGIVRNSYKIGRFEQEFDRGFMSEFDRWLAEVKAQERKVERERIIELLEERRNTLMEIVSDCAPDGDSQNQMMDALNDANDLEHLIALIKGEEQ